MIDLNNRALVALTHLFLPDMVAHNKGQIIQVASVVAFTAAPFFAVYAASKAFVLSFARALMMELERPRLGLSLFVRVQLRLSLETWHSTLGPAHRNF